MSVKVEPNQFFHSDGVWEPNEEQLAYIQKILKPLPFDATIYVLISGVLGSQYTLKPKDTLILKPEHVRRKDVIVHEFGHHVWHKLFDIQQQRAWKQLVDQQGYDIFKRKDHDDIYNESLAHTIEYTWALSKRIKNKEKADILKKFLLDRLLKEVKSAYEYSPYSDDEDNEKIDAFFDKYIAPYPRLRKLDFMFFPFGKKDSEKSGLWFDAYFGEKKRDLNFPKGWLYNMTEDRVWTLIHELGHAWHLEDKKILEKFKPVSTEMEYYKAIHSNKEQLLGDRFADAVAEYVVHSQVLKSNAPNVYKFIKQYIMKNSINGESRMKNLTKELKKRGYTKLAAKIKARFIRSDEEGLNTEQPANPEDSTTKLQEAIIGLLKKNPNARDADVHKLAEDLRVSPDILEDATYKLLADLVKGVGRHADVPDDKYDPKQLEMGIKVEHEHTDNDAIAKEIAKDHLSEPGLEKNYYSLLKKMEEDAKRAAGIKENEK